MITVLLLFIMSWGLIGGGFYVVYAQQKLTNRRLTTLKRYIEDALSGNEFEDFGVIEEEAWMYEGKFLDEMDTNQLLEALKWAEDNKEKDLIKAIKDELKKHG